MTLKHFHKKGSFIEIIVTHPFYEAVTIYDGSKHLASKLHIGTSLTPYDGTYMWLGDTDYPMLYTMRPVLIHVKLLFIKNPNCP
ncbi:MAG TPA: hypothetical protein VFC96_04980 [Anaerovoracaceae bacterium]|nr:hypothetical protein [Anaerovoracaceae bacterium]